MSTVGTPGSIRAVPVSAGHLGQGVSYPLTFDTTGRLTLSSGVQSVSDSLKSILLTVPGERVMQPDYGANIFALEPIDLGRFRSKLEENIIEHEPRIKRFELDLSISQTNPGEVTVFIQFYTSNEATPETLVFPYYSGPA